MVKKLTFLNLRKEIDLIRENAGFYWVALRSAQLDKRCYECLKSLGGETEGPNPNCKACLGTSYPFIDKLVEGYRYLTTPGFDFKSEIGVINTEAVAFILKYNKQPKSTDFITELQLNEDTLVPVQPYKITRVFKIQDAFPLRGDKGRIEFWRCFVEERNHDVGRSML